MKQLRFKVGAIGVAGTIAAATVVGALALQHDSGPGSSSGDTARTIEDTPIQYAGGYGLYPNVR